MQMHIAFPRLLFLKEEACRLSMLSEGWGPSTLPSSSNISAQDYRQANLLFQQPREKMPPYHCASRWGSDSRGREGIHELEQSRQGKDCTPSFQLPASTLHLQPLTAAFKLFRNPFIDASLCLQSLSHPSVSQPTYGGP